MAVLSSLRSCQVASSAGKLSQRTEAGTSTPEKHGVRGVPSCGQLQTNACASFAGMTSDNVFGERPMQLQGGASKAAPKVLFYVFRVGMRGCLRRAAKRVDHTQSQRAPSRRAYGRQVRFVSRQTVTSKRPVCLFSHFFVVRATKRFE